MGRRGPRGDLTRERILQAADALVIRQQDVGAVSLRMLAGELGVTANAIYTYFPSLGQIIHDLADQRLGRLHVDDLLTDDSGGVGCRHCALRELLRRTQQLYASPGTLLLLKAQPVLGENSFRLSESVMQLCEGAELSPRDCHDLIMGWFYGSASLAAEGWTAGTDDLRASGRWDERFPRVAARADPDQPAQFEAILRGIGIIHHAA